MIEKIHKIKKLRLDKNEIKLFNLFENLYIKKYKSNYFLIYEYQIYFEIDVNNKLIWINFDLINLRLDIDINFNWVKLKYFIKEYFNLNLESYFIFSFPVLFNKKIFYLGKPRKNNNLYNFICFFKKNILSLSNN